MMNDAARQGEEIARAVAIAARTSIGSRENVKKLMDDTEFREKIHSSFRQICRSSGARYLYLFSVDENECRHYMICAAKSDEDDERMNTEYGFGSVNPHPLYDAERKVLSGDDDGEYEFIDNDYGYVCMFVLPATDGKEYARALIGVDYDIKNIIDIAHDNAKILLGQVVILIGLAFVLSLVLIRHSVIRPILALSGRMRNFVRDRENDSGQDRRETPFEDEITDIEKSFDEMAGDITKYVNDIRLLAAEKAQNQAQLDIARKIHLGIVPRERGLSGSGYEIYGCELPAREVGGDFYDMFSPDDEHVCTIVGDISGKGISAALFMVMVKTSLRAKIVNGCPLDEALNLLNNEICQSNPENMFATVFAMMLDTKTGRLEYANAGHEPPLILRGDISALSVDPGIALGVFEDSDIVRRFMTFEKGEGILVFTDGVTEAVNAEKKQFGKAALKKAAGDSYMENGGSYDAERLVKAVVDSVRAHSGEQEQFDDITCVALVYGPEHDKGKEEAV